MDRTDEDRAEVDWAELVDDEVALGLRPEPDYAPEPDFDTTRKDDGLPDQCVSSITVGQNHYWCERGKRDHGGLCGGSDPWGGNVEWRFWVGP